MKIYLYDDKVGSVEYISHMGSDLSVVNAARVSFGAQKRELDEKDIKLINYLMSHNHTSPFEHCAITMRFVVPLFIRSQHHRHRTWAYNEISRRYTSVDMKFYEPKMFRGQHQSNRQASTDNLVDLLKFVSLRSHSGAQWEIQRVAEACLSIANKHFPSSVQAYKKTHME
jgi:thymidylate synthase (FAD)